MKPVAETTALDLFAATSTGTGLTDSGFAPKLLCAAISQLFANLGVEDATAEHLQSRASDFEAWTTTNLPCLFMTFVTRNGKGRAYVAIPHRLFEQVFVAYYGGGDADPSDREALTHAQSRFAERLAAKLASAISASWLETHSVNFESETIAFSESELCNPESRALFTIVEIVTSLNATERHSISIALSSDVVSKRLGANPNAGTTMQARTNDWAEKLMKQAGSVRLPVRAILARPEIPAARLLTMKCGDVIPIIIPTVVPVSVGGRLFAKAKMGERQGSVAICIENVGKGVAL